MALGEFINRKYNTVMCLIIGKPKIIHFPLVRKWNINPLYTGGLFHCYILEESICHLRGVGSVLSLLFYF